MRARGENGMIREKNSLTLDLIEKLMNSGSIFIVIVWKVLMMRLV